MPDCEYKYVRFDKWCEKCKYKDLKEFKSPCTECLQMPVNTGSEKPVNFKEG